MGLYGVCIDLKVQFTAVSAVFSQIIKPTIYPKTRFSFGRLEYTLLEFIIIVISIIILMHGIAYYTSFMFFHAAIWKKKLLLFLCSFTCMNNL